MKTLIRPWNTYVPFANLLFLFLFTGFLSIESMHATELISRNSVWKYWDDGPGISSSWMDLGFNDATWDSGQGQLGYGDSDENTVIGYGGDPDNKYITAYFRHTFNHPINMF